MSPRARKTVGQLVLLAGAILVAPAAFELLLGGALSLAGIAQAQPLLAVLAALMAGALAVILVLALRMKFGAIANFIARFLLLALSFAAFLAAAELVMVAVVSLGIEWPDDIGAETILLACSGLALLLLGAAGFRYALQLRVRYWLAALGILLLLLLYIAAGGVGIFTA